MSKVTETDRVIAPKGFTVTGRNEMERHGCSVACIKGIKLSAERAGGLYNE